MSDFDHAIEKAKQLAGTPEGRQLAALLQQLGQKDLQQTLEKAARGDLQQVQQVIHTLMHDPQARQLLEKLGGSNGK